MNAFILAGGQSTRMGRDKALLEFRGRPLIEHALGKLHTFGLSTCIVGNRPDLAAYAPFITDNYLNSGPLAGIEAALSASDAGLNLFLPVDLPLLPVDFLRWMTNRASETSALGTIPYQQNRPQPLCAVYNRELLPHVQRALRAGDRKVIHTIEHAAAATGLKLDCFNIETIAACLDFSAAEPVHRWFQNLNTPADLENAALEELPFIQ